MARLRGLIFGLMSVLIVGWGDSVSGATAPASGAYLPLSSPRTAGIADLVLIYQGGTHRRAWTPDELAPYVSFKAPDNPREQWLFDGFLFIEFKDNRGREYARGYQQKPGRKEDWLWLIERHFEKGHAIDALDQVVARTAERIGAPLRRRQVVLTLPEPIHDQRDWGELDGRPLDFANPDDRIAACAWHIRIALARWETLAPRHLDLAGFYWVAEHSAHGNAILPRVAADIHAIGKRFYWIPYWAAAGAANWQKLGFDAAYQQPNHFFNPEIPDQRIDLACAFARTNGMGLEFECDWRAVQSADVFRPRLHAYLQGFERNGVQTQAAMAYYEGGGALLRMAQSDDPEAWALYQAVARWVASRQQRIEAQQ